MRSIPRTAWRLLAPLLAVMRDLALPPRCPGCGALVSAQSSSCAVCWRDLAFLGPPWCAGCNTPFDHDRGATALCEPCLARPPRHAGVRAAVAYGEVARTLALRLKYGRRTADAGVAAALMVRHLPPDAELIVPVPLHRGRLWSRGYNQAALIAGRLAALGAVESNAAALERIRATPVLRGHSPAQRRAALRGAIRVAQAALPSLRGRHIVLVDDVYTTGATTDACVDALLGSGAARVTILTWARVLAGDGRVHGAD